MPSKASLLLKNHWQGFRQHLPTTHMHKQSASNTLRVLHLNTRPWHNHTLELHDKPLMPKEKLSRDDYVPPLSSSSIMSHRSDYTKSSSASNQIAGPTSPSWAFTQHIQRRQRENPSWPHQIGRRQVAREDNRCTWKQPTPDTPAKTLDIIYCDVTYLLVKWSM